MLRGWDREGLASGKGMCNGHSVCHTRMEWGKAAI